MPPSSTSTPRTTMLARSIARRAGRAVFFNTLGVLLAYSLPAVLILVVALRRWSDAGWWFAVPAGTVLLASGTAGLLTARRWWSLTRAAGEGDRQLGLKDELRSAVELDDSTDDPFTALAVRSGEAKAAGLQSRALRFPIRRGAWIIAGLVFLCTIAAGLWIPVNTPGPTDPRFALAETDRATRAINTARQVLDRSEETQTESPHVREALDELNALEDELLGQPESGEEAPARAAAKLDELAKELEHDAEEQQRLQNELSDRLSRQNRDRSGEDSSPLDEFSDALSEQDYEAAREALENLREQSSSMSDADREAIREQLEELANAIEPDNTEPTAQSPPEPGDPGSDKTEPENNQSIDNPSQREEPNTTPDPDPPEDTPQNRETESTDRPQDQPAERSPSERLSEALREEAERMRDQSPQNQEPAAQPQNQDRSERTAPEQEGTEQEQQQQQGNEEQQPPQSKPGEREQESQQQQGQPQPEQSGEQTTEQQTDQNPAQEPSQETGQNPAERQAREPSGSEQDPSGEQREQGGEQDQPGEKNESLDEVLREMEDTQRRLERQRQDADDLRRVARELIQPDQNQSPPGDQQEITRPGQEDGEPRNQSPLGSQPGDENRDNTPINPSDQPEYIPVDGRQPGETGNARKAGEWYAPDDPNASPTERARSADRLRRAADSAKRAVDNQQVPRKYRDLIRDVYKRVEKRADEVERSTGVQPGKDAEHSESKP